MPSRLAAFLALPAYRDVTARLVADPTEPSHYAALHFLAFEHGCEALDRLHIGERSLTVNGCWEESVRLLEQRRRGLPPPARRRALPAAEAEDVGKLQRHMRRFAPDLDPRLASAMVEYAPQALPQLPAPLLALQGRAAALLTDFFGPAPTTSAQAEALLLAAREVLASAKPAPAGQRLGAEAYAALALLLLDVPARAALPATRRPFAADAEAALERYMSALNAGAGVDVAQDARFDPIALIALALLASMRGKHEDASGLISCARRFPACTGAGALNHATGDLKELEDAAAREAGAERPSARSSWEAEKARLANDALKEGGGEPAERGLLPLPAMDELMGLIGLEGVKQGARALYDRVLVARRSGTKGPPPNVPLNFRLLGNPGTGKSIVSRLLAALLVQLGLRPGEEAVAAAAASAASSDAGAEERARQTRVAAELAEEAAALPAKVAAGELAALGVRAACVKASLEANEAAPLSSIGSAGLHQPVLNATKQAQAAALVELRRLTGDLAAKAEAARRSKEAAEAADAKRKAAAAGQVGVAASGAPSAPAGPKRFVETSGGKLQQDGVGALEEIVEGLLAAVPPGGTIFIDEAHQLAGADPTGNSAPVVKRLVKYSEDHRAVLTFILAGYPEPMQALLDMDVGLARRFPELPTNCFRMADYSAGELAAIFRSKVEEKNEKLDAAAAAAAAAHAPPPAPERWHLEDPKTAEVVGRRLARGAGRVGFGNGGAVDTLLNGTIRARMDRRLKRAMLEARARGADLPRAEYFTIKLEDALGPKPDVARSSAYRELMAMVGLARVKEEVGALLRHLDAMWQAEARCEEPLTVPRLNRIFSGGPGCGKTTVALLYGRILAECGFLSSGEVEVYKPSDFIGSALGESEKKTAAILERCKGKVCVIDEAYGLGVSAATGARSSGGGGGSSSYHEAVQTALAAGVPAEAGADMCVCLLGYPDSMDNFMQHANPGLQRRFRDKFVFDNYKKPELKQILLACAARAHVALPDDVADSAAALLEKESMLRSFGNADAAGALFDRLQAAAIARTEGARQAGPLALTAGDLASLQRADAAKEAAFMENEPLAAFVAVLARQVALAAAVDLPPPPLPHVLFTGNPGTGKTSLARYLGHLLQKAGLLVKGQVVETTGEELVGSFVGQTKDKVRELLLASAGGILFVDEAHRLGGAGGGGSFKQEALGALLTGMTSDEFRGKLMVVFAGYETPLRELLAADPGLTRRFTGTVNFPDLEPREAEAKLLYVLARELKPKTVAREALSTAAAEGAVASAFRKLRDANGAAWGNLGDVATFAQMLFKVASRRVAVLVAAARESGCVGGGTGAQPAAIPQGLWDMSYSLADVQEVGSAFVKERLGLSVGVEGE